VELEESWFQDPQAAAAHLVNTAVCKGCTRIYIYIYIYYKFFGGKKFLTICTPLPNAIFSSNNSQLAPSLLFNEKF